MSNQIKFWACGAVLLVGVAMADQQKLTLVRTLKPGSTEEYLIGANMKTVVSLPNGMGEQEFTVTSLQNCQLNLGSVDKKLGAAVDGTFTFLKYEMSGPVPGSDEEPPKSSTVHGRLDSRGRLILKGMGGGSSGDILGSSSQSASFGPFIELPDHPIPVNGKWQIAIPKNPMIKTTRYLDAKIVGTSVLKGVKVWKVTLSGKLNFNSGQMTLPNETNGQPNPMAGQKMSITGTMSFTGIGYLDQTTGQTLSLTTNIHSEQAAEIVDLGMTIKSKTDVKSTVTKI
jgi:hypothetical protein